MAAFARFVRHVVFLGLLAATAAPSAFAAATVTVIPFGAAFTDPTPVAPVGGNSGTTVGEQRRIALQHAANLWAQQLDSPVEIFIFTTFETITGGCTQFGAVLASASTTQIFANFGSVGAFPGELLPFTWHNSALADKRAGVELSPNALIVPPTHPLFGIAPAPDVVARFNIDVGKPTCLQGPGWYYGLDANEPAGGVDIVATALHEFGHGLGFQQFADLDPMNPFEDGSQILDLSDVYASFLLDTTTFKRWNQMTNAERFASATNSRRLVWDGPVVHASAPSVLTPGTPILTVHSPASVARLYDVGTALFGPPLSAAGLTGSVVQALDPANAAGPTTTDGCSPFANAAAVLGNIAMVDRGTCGFIVKVANAQAAGAVAVIVADNAPGGPPPPLGGADPAITIPSVRITLADGNILKAALASGVNATLGVDLSLLAGADAAGRVHLNAPSPISQGSSISHWDPIASPNLLMEPAIGGDLTHSLQPPRDLSVAVLRDIGWFEDADNEGLADELDDCDGSDLRSTIFVGPANTGVDNVLFTTGCTMSDYIAAAAAGAGTHGAFVSAVAHLTDAWEGAHLISSASKGTIQSAAARSSIGKH